MIVRISKTLKNLHVGDMVTAEIKNSAAGKVHHQLIVGRSLVKGELVLFDLTTATVVSESAAVSAYNLSGELIENWLASRDDILRIYKE